MKKAITTVHTILVITVLIATAGWSAYYLYNQRQINSEKNTARIPQLAQSVSDAFKQSGSLYNNAFGDDIKQLFSENDDLVALTVYSYDTGIEYFYSRNNQVSIGTVPLDEQVYQTPEYKGLGFESTIGSIPLNLPDKPGTNVDCVFTVLSRTSIFYVLKVSLMIVIVLFFLTLVLIVIISLGASSEKQKEEQEEEWSGSMTDESAGFEGPGETGFLPDEASLSSEPTGFSSESPLEELDMPEESEVFSASDDFESEDMNLDDLNFDDMNLEESIPDIPDEEDLFAMAHEEVPVALPEEEEEVPEDLDFPEEDLFDEVSSGDLIEDMEEDDFELPVEESVSSEKEPPSLYNPETGLGWEHFLEERLGLELERAASFDQDLVLIIIRNNSFTPENMDSLTSMIKEKYTYHDLVFEAGETGLAVIDPNKDLDDAIADVQDLMKKIEDSLGNSETKAGLSSRNGRLISGSRLIREANSSLNKSDEDNPIVGFRSDPERFREYLSHNA